MVKNKYYAVINYNYFCFNFNYNFIEKCWKDDPHLIDHLKKKFDDAYERDGAVGSIPRFMTELDRDNQIKFSKWINENYKGFKEFHEE